MNSGYGQPEVPQPSFQEKQDADQLSLLGVLWKVYAVLVAAGTCFGLFYLLIGAAVASLPDARSTPGETAVLGGVFAVVGIGIMLVTATVSVLSWIVSMRLEKRRGYMFCLVMACLVCIMPPIGTALGVFSIVVLNRQSVKALFA